MGRRDTQPVAVTSVWDKCVRDVGNGWTVVSLNAIETLTARPYFVHDIDVGKIKETV
jgi:hypothetical protein